MPWTMLDDGFPDHPKLVSLTMEQGYLWVLGINYCNRYLTDGHIPTGALAALHPHTPLTKKKRMAAVLVTAGLWDETPTGWAIHDFHDYQLSAEDVKDRRAKRAEAGRKGGRRSGQIRRSKAEANASSNGEASAQANASPTVRSKREPLPIPSQPLVANDYVVSRPQGGETAADGTAPGETNEGVIHEALRILAELDYDKAAAVRTIRKPGAYFDSCLADRSKTDQADLAALHEKHPDLDADALAHQLEADRYLA
jgi:hypothetical protein